MSATYSGGPPPKFHPGQHSVWVHGVYKYIVLTCKYLGVFFVAGSDLQGGQAQGKWDPSSRLLAAAYSPDRRFARGFVKFLDGPSLKMRRGGGEGRTPCHPFFPRRELPSEIRWNHCRGRGA